MKKFLISAALVQALATSATAYAAEIPIRLNQSNALLENSAISDDGKLFLPLHDIIYATGERIRYDSKNEAAYVTKDGVDYACFCTNIQTDNSEFDGHSAKKIDGELYITPESFVKIYGGSVAWDKKENIIDITEKNYLFGLDEIQLFRPAETIIKIDKNGDTRVEVCEKYFETMELKNGISEYVKEVEENRIPVISLTNTYYGIDYSIKQAFKNHPTAAITLTRGNNSYIYTIHFKEI